MVSNTGTKDMTVGDPKKIIISFAIPIFLSQLFQQLYNTVDSLIVGKFLGSEALAAVTSSGSLIFLMVGFFNGIAIGAGSDVAIETADIALMQDDISKIPYLFSLSNKTMRIIKQDISIAIAVKMLCVIFAILGVITLMMSVGFGDLGLTMLVILNSFRIGMVKDSLF